MARRLSATISEPGNDSPKRLPMNGIDCNWRINERGQASAELETKTLRDAGLLSTVDACEGYWFSYRHRRLGPWAGVIQQVIHDLGTGTTEVAAETFEALFDKRLTEDDYEIPTGDAGGLAKKAIMDVGRGGSVYITSFKIGVTGLVDVIARGEQLVDLVDQLAALADAEWRVTTSRVFEFAPKLGENKTASVVLLNGRDIGPNSRIMGDRRPKVNKVVAKSGVSAYTRKTAVVVRDDRSIERTGEREGEIVFPYLIRQSALLPAARKELARLLRLGRSATIEVLDTHGAWSAFREGDVVRLRVPSCGVRLDFRIMVRAWDSTSDRLMVSGELTPS